VFLGINDGGAISSIKGVDDMIILPITQLQLILSMAIAEVFLVSDPNYTVTIGSENYFSLAVGAFVGGIFIFILVALKVGNSIKFKQVKSEEKILVKVRQT
jgi:hypothetical protein